MQQLNKNAVITISSCSTTLHSPLLRSFLRSCHSEIPWPPTEKKENNIRSRDMDLEVYLECKRAHVHFSPKMCDECVYSACFRENLLRTFLTTSIPSTTFPNTTCFPSSQLVLALVMKNWLPLVLGPAFAMESIPGSVWVSLKFSSSNLVP